MLLHSAGSMSEIPLTPMMQQYRQIKKQIPSDTILLFRLGDFYEMFFEDAKVGSHILNVALTQRNGTPMCGVPFHAAKNYVSRLVNAGHRVAICDQMEEARPGQVVRREITQVLSPGSLIDSETIAAGRPHFMAAVYANMPSKSAPSKYGVAFLETTTGDFCVTECETAEELLDEIRKNAPPEIIFPDNWTPRPPFLAATHVMATAHEGWTFQPENAAAALREHFQTQSLDGFGCQDITVGVGAAGALLHYVKQTLRRSLEHVQTLRAFNSGAFMMLDETTRQTLELTEPAHRHTPQEHTLLGVLDKTRTGMGARLLRHWVLHPLRSLNQILSRQTALKRLLEMEFPLAELRETLGEVRDMERALGRLAQGSGNGRDLLSLKSSLLQIPKLLSLLSEPLPGLLGGIPSKLDPLPEAVDMIQRSIQEDCPPVLRDGGVIAAGFDAALDDLRSAAASGKDWVAQLQQQEQERTGIKSLKVRYNSVFGYYIEITKSNLSSVPQDYIRRQTTANGERFVTPELKEMESKILGAEDRAKALEAELFHRVRQDVLKHASRIQLTAAALAELDALGSLAEVAKQRNYKRPEIVENAVVEITEGRHPVLEQLAMDERFVPNDTSMNADTARLVILTGPNMAGKSTYLRQVALLTLLAHIGSYLPCQTARIGLVDRIFTRVGASDDLSRGQSTFMVEMNETANILNHATGRSLVVLDEIGRGTSTFDGLSIAWAVAEHLHSEIRAMTLFATHYHETTTLSHKLRAARLVNVAVREWNDQVIFLRKIIAGPADKSYGIQVARLAGLPKTVLQRAKSLLQQLEEGQMLIEHKASVKTQSKPPARKKRKKKNAAPPEDLFAGF